MNVQQEIHIEKILEYDDLFLGEDFDIEATLCKYSRELIIRLVNCLGLTYEKAYLPDANNPFFSSLTPKVQDLDYRLSHFFVIICFFMVIFVPFDYLNIRRSGTFPLFRTTQNTILFVLVVDTFIPNRSLEITHYVTSNDRQ